MTTRVAPQVGLDPAPQWAGVYLATVVSTRATDQAARLQIPQLLGQAVSNWALPVGQANAPGGVAPGTVVLAMFVGGNINVPVWMPYNLPAQVPAPEPDEWHDLRPCSTGFNGTNSGYYPPQYRFNGDNSRVEIFGVVKVPTSGGGSTAIFANALPPGYRPGNNVEIPVNALDGGSEQAWVLIATSGFIEFKNLPTSLGPTYLIEIDVSYPVGGTLIAA